MLGRTGLLRSPWLCTVLFCAVAGLAILLAGCGSSGSKALKTVKMGERVQVGPLIYTVLEAEWKSAIGDPPDVKYPRHKFLVIRLTVTNSGAAESSIPHTTLVDAQGNSYSEGVEGQHIPEWLPVLRRVKPAETEQGRVYFDAPPGAQSLRVADDADPGQEQFALVEIPLHLEPEESPNLPSVPGPTAPGKQ
jgi:hypothetical protein